MHVWSDEAPHSLQAVLGEMVRMQGKFGRRYGDRSLAPVNMVSCVGVWENVWIEGIDGVFWRLACCTVQYSTAMMDSGSSV
jgi:hypothetical protein